MKNKIQTITIIILLVMLLALAERCNFNNKTAALNYTALRDTVSYYTNISGTQTATINTMILQHSQLKKTILAKDKELAALSKQFSKVQNITKYKQVIKYDTINVVFKDSVPCRFTKNGSVQSKWYSLQYKAHNKGFIIDSLTIHNQTTVVTGFKRKWFLGKETLITDVTNSNPYVTTATLQSILIPVRVPWYKKWYIWATCGVAGGLLIVK